MLFSFMFSVFMSDILTNFCHFSVRNRRAAAKTCVNKLCFCFAFWACLRLFVVFIGCCLWLYPICISIFSVCVSQFMNCILPFEFAKSRRREENLRK